METNQATQSSQGGTAQSGSDRQLTMKIAYNITESKGRKYWTRIGRAFINRDGSINVVLESFPVTGQLQLRDYEPYEDRHPGGGGGDGGGGPSVVRSRTASSNHGPLTELPF